MSCVVKLQTTFNIAAYLFLLSTNIRPAPISVFSLMSQINNRHTPNITKDLVTANKVNIFDVAFECVCT